MNMLIILIPFLASVFIIWKSTNLIIENHKFFPFVPFFIISFIFVLSSTFNLYGYRNIFSFLFLKVSIFVCILFVFGSIIVRSRKCIFWIYSSLLWFSVYFSIKKSIIGRIKVIKRWFYDLSFRILICAINNINTDFLWFFIFKPAFFTLYLTFELN